MFFIDISKLSYNDKIFDLNRIYYSQITVEEPRKKRMVPQCVRCQQFGHTRTYCNHAPRCVRCGHGHDTTTCTKSRDTPARCANCKGDHPANYRGCEVLKNLRKQKAARHNRPQQTSPPPLSSEEFPALEQNGPQEQVEQQRPSKPQMRTLQNATSPPQNKPSCSGMRREATQQPPSAGNQLTPQLYQLLNGLNSLIQPLFSLLQQLAQVTQAMYPPNGP